MKYTRKEFKVAEAIIRKDISVSLDSLLKGLDSEDAKYICEQILCDIECRIDSLSEEIGGQED